MKWLKVFFFVCAIAGALLLAAMMVLFSQPVQRHILAQLVDPRPGDIFEVEHSRIGLTRTEVRGFRLERPDIAYRVEYLSADLSIFDIYFRDHVRIGDIEARGVEFDYTGFVQEPRPEDQDPLKGLLGELDVPVMLTIGNGVMEGRLLFGGAGDEPLTIDYRITGGGLAPGATGEFDVDIRIEDPNAEGWLRALEGRGEIRLSQAEDGVLTRLESEAFIHVMEHAAPLEELIAEVTMIRREGGEDYRGALHHAPAGEVAQPLLIVEAAFSDEDRSFRGDWEAWAERGQVAGFLFVQRLPEFQGSGSGRFSYLSDDRSFSVRGSFEAETGELAILAEEMRGLGGVAAETDFEFARGDDWWLLEHFRLQLGAATTGEILVSAETSHPIRYHSPSGEIVAPEDGTRLMEVFLRHAPIEWAGLFRGEDAGEMPVLLDGNISGGLVIDAYEGGLLLATVRPLTARPVTVRTGDEILISEAGLRLSGAVSWIDDQIGARVEPMEFTIDDQVVLSIHGRFSQIERIISARLQGDLPALLSQPVLGMENLVQGEIDAEFAGDLDGNIRGMFLLHNARAAGEEDMLPPIYVDFEAQPTGDGWRFETPIRVDRQEMPFSFVVRGQTGRDEADQLRLDAEITGEHLFLEPFLELTRALLPEREEPREIERDDAPFWAMWNGTITVAFDSIQLPTGYAVEDLNLRILARDYLDLSADAVFLGSPLSVRSEVAFDESLDLPYRLRGTLEAEHIDLGAAFRAAQPDRPPTLEGIFGAAADLRGDGQALGELFSRIQGNITLASRDGTLRLFYTENPLVHLGIGIAGLLGGLGGELGTIGEIADEFADIPFDRFLMEVTRGADLNYHLEKLSILSPEFHLQASGMLTHVEEADFADQPLDIEVQIGARGDLEELLIRAGMLGEQRDERGFRQLATPFRIEGTAGDLDVNPLVSVVVGAVLELAAPIPGRATQAEEGAAPPLEVEYGDATR